MSSKPGVLNDPRREDFRAAILKSVPHLDSPAVQYAVSAAARELGLFSSRTSVSDVARSLFGRYVSRAMALAALAQKNG